MGKLLLLVLAAALGAVGFYFFLRANPKKKAVIDKVVNKAV